MIKKKIILLLSENEMKSIIYGTLAAVLYLNQINILFHIKQIIFLFQNTKKTSLFKIKQICIFFLKEVKETLSQN